MADLQVVHFLSGGGHLQVIVHPVWMAGRMRGTVHVNHRFLSHVEPERADGGREGGERRGEARLGGLCATKNGEVADNAKVWRPGHPNLLAQAVQVVEVVRLGLVSRQVYA